MIEWKETKIEHNVLTENKKCVVVVPVYKEKLNTVEEYSLKQVVNILGDKYEIVLVCPFSLDITIYNKIANYNFSILRCNNNFFVSQKSYSDLCEMWQFYDSFNEYEYMLIYQLDAWIFEDRLDYFINLDYDYIGAVHLVGLSEINKEGENGNGGFSLRKIKKFIDVCKTVDFKKVPYWQLEDCAFTQRFKSYFNLAPLNICREFSFHEKPKMQFEKNNNKLPMGCHAWMKYDKYFWKQYIGREEFKDLFSVKETTIRNILKPIYGSVDFRLSNRKKTRKIL